MPNVGLLEAGNPLPPEAQVSIRYVVEVEGLPVYTELYDVSKLREESAGNRDATVAAWVKRLDGPIECRDKPNFSAEVTAFLHTD
jgi:hypothetical protein